MINQYSAALENAIEILLAASSTYWSDLEWIHSDDPVTVEIWIADRLNYVSIREAILEHPGFYKKLTAAERFIALDALAFHCGSIGRDCAQYLDQERRSGREWMYTEKCLSWNGCDKSPLLWS